MVRLVEHQSLRTKTANSGWPKNLGLCSVEVNSSAVRKQIWMQANQRPLQKEQVARYIEGHSG